MSGDHPSKHELEDAKVYIHEKDEASSSQNIHIDIEHPKINEVIEPGENSFVGGKKGGVFIGLKDQMIERAEKLVDRLDK
jgi:hypothetical protein